MKQHITIEQLNELSDRGKEKLREWWKPKRGDMFFGIDRGIVANTWNEIPNGIYPRLNIGQLIEYLAEKTKDITYVDDYFENQIGFNHTYGSLNNSTKSPKKGIPYAIAWGSQKLKGELCDALWQAVEEDLESD